VRVDVPGKVERTVFAPDGRMFTIVAGEEGTGEIVGYRVGIGGAAQPTSDSGT
jgi:hypothetical protein